MTSSRDDSRPPLRYRLSFAALLAVVVAALFVWMAVAAILPRWDGSLVTLDADVVSMYSRGSGRNRTDYTLIRFTALDGRIVTTTMSNSSVQAGATTVRIRYDPQDPRAAFEDSTIIPYVLALGVLFGAGFLLWLAYIASLPDWRKHFVRVP